MGSSTSMIFVPPPPLSLLFLPAALKELRAYYTILFFPVFLERNLGLIKVFPLKHEPAACSQKYVSFETGFVRYC